MCPGERASMLWHPRSTELEDSRLTRAWSPFRTIHIAVGGVRKVGTVWDVYGVDLATVPRQIPLV